MKNFKILVVVVFIPICLTACKKKTLHTSEIIRKYNLTYYPYWDSENTPFRKNATLYANKETDSCLLVLKNKEDDTILCHLDKSIVTITKLQYEKNHNDWVVLKRDYGKTIYDLDSIGDWYGSISGSNSKNLPMNEYYTIDRKKKKFKRIKPVSKKELLDKIASRFSHLKKCTIAALDNTNTYVFKDTLNDKQVLYQLETKYITKYTEGKYVLQPEFGKAYSNGIYKNKVAIYESPIYNYFGEKVQYGKHPWQNELRYRMVSKKYFRFKAHVKNRDNSPGNEIFKTQIFVKDSKNKTTKIIKDFPKDSLFENHNFVLENQRNGKVYVGVDGPDHSTEMYYELDTIHWKLTKLKE
ncbi:hypothetical protein [Flavobacterium sangjuense]|uniref:Uncharacterized protein n=1 Tax=Flavobacterium sangjuense TaxID=2518177 RepID=A0A4V1CC00_9FLAO|nr:hypothetical protein [Flavobacterium sangjuense]QBZ97754.1 hypothetical protein GS03_01252 [Flavobacterium sangjuense]